MRAPDDMTPVQRREEIADILARGLRRSIALKSRKNNSFDDILLDCEVKESVYATKR